MMTGATEICPKSMSYGPCGGVRPDGSCEVDQRPCPFVDRLTLEPASPSGPQSGAQSLGVPSGFEDIVARTPLILVDVRAPRAWSGDLQRLWEATADTLDGCVALIGEHVDNPAHDDDSGALATVAVIGTLATRGRLAMKRRAGAAAAVLNHGGEVEHVSMKKYR